MGDIALLMGSRQWVVPARDLEALANQLFELLSLPRASAFGGPSASTDGGVVFHEGNCATVFKFVSRVKQRGSLNDLQL